eukprot:gene18876-22578_t
MTQEKLLYFPDTSHFLLPAQYGFDASVYEEVILRASDGVRIQAWFFRQKNAKNASTMLFCHSNAGTKHDELVPSSHMKQLEQEATLATKKMVVFDQGQHMTLMLQPNYYKYIKDFLDSVFEN